MSLPTDAAPPGHLPPAASAPWPIQPPPHGATRASIPVRSPEPRNPLAPMIALAAAGAAAAIGLAFAVPRLLRGADTGRKHRRRSRAKA